MSVNSNGPTDANDLPMEEFTDAPTNGNNGSASINELIGPAPVGITSRMSQRLPKNIDESKTEHKYEDITSKEDSYSDIKHLCETWFNSSGGLNTIIFEYWRFIRWKLINENKICDSLTRLLIPP